MPQVQVIQPIQQQPKRLRVAAYARVSSDSEDQLNSLAVQVDYYCYLDPMPDSRTNEVKNRTKKYKGFSQ